MHISQSDVVVGTGLVLYIVFFAMSPPAVVRTLLSHPVGVAASFGIAIYLTLYHSKPIGGLLIVALLASMTRVTEHLTDAEKTSARAELDGVNRTISDLEGMGLVPERNDALKNALLRRTQLQQQLAGPSTAGGASSKCPPGYTYAGGSNSCMPQGGGEFLCPSDSTKVIGRNGEKSCIPNSRLQEALASGQVTVYNAGTTPSAPAATSPAPAAPPSAPQAARKPEAPPAPAAKPVMACNIENFAPF
jgi:hypothetical protein